MPDSPGTVGLYVVTPPSLSASVLQNGIAEIAASGAVACIQLWMRDVDRPAVREMAKTLRPVSQDQGVAFIINGDPELAAELGCDGVHFDDPAPRAIKAAKRVLGEDSIVGASCGSSRHAAMLAAEAGADYVSFGPVFRTETKGLDADPAALDALAWWSEMMEVPCIGVGGITASNANQVVTSGADFIVAVSAIWNHPEGPGAGARAFADALQA